MKGKDLKYLSRKELIEVLYEMKKREIALKAELEETKAKLESKELKLKDTGNLAEAAFSLNGVFEAAQTAAENYLELVKAAYPLPNEEAAENEEIEKSTETAEEAPKEISEENPEAKQEEKPEEPKNKLKKLLQKFKH